MKYLHFVRIRVFSNPEDDKEKVIEKLKELIPFNLKDEKIEIKSKKTQGFEEKIIYVLEIELKKATHTNKFIKNLVSKLNNEQKTFLKKQIDSRLDEGNRFFIRLDKKKLLNNEYFITDEGNCYHISMCIACYPSTTEKAKEVINEIFK